MEEAEGRAEVIDATAATDNRTEDAAQPGTDGVRRSESFFVTHPRFMSCISNAPLGIVITLAIMAALILIVNMANIPNPNMILVTGLVVCTAVFGYPSGITAAIAMMAYTLFFFSTDNNFVTFTDQNIQKVLVSAIGIIVITFFVSGLRQIVARTIQDLEKATGILEDDNRLLEEASSVDALTETRNRFALRRDFTQYIGKNLHVMMLDIDNFKELNDSAGHDYGDAALTRMGGLLNGLFGEEHVYRYGGDEFLVICTGIAEPHFARMVLALRDQATRVSADRTYAAISFSAGYVYGVPSTEKDLRLMIRQADANLYDSKNSGKNQATGCAYSRAASSPFKNRKSGANGHAQANIRHA